MCQYSSNFQFSNDCSSFQVRLSPSRDLHALLCAGLLVVAGKGQTDSVATMHGPSRLAEAEDHRSALEDLRQRLNVVQSGLAAVQSQMHEQQASIISAIAVQGAVLERIVSLVSPSNLAD